MSVFIESNFNCSIALAIDAFDKIVGKATFERKEYMLGIIDN
ncbi:MAG: hypothetical protein ACJBCI_01395 [Candidatus Tisiphia sp.]